MIKEHVNNPPVGGYRPTYDYIFEKNSPKVDYNGRDAMELVGK